MEAVLLVLEIVECGKRVECTVGLWLGVRAVGSVLGSGFELVVWL